MGNKILFSLVPIMVFSLFMSSNEPIPKIFNTNIKDLLIIFSYPSIILFNISTGYLSGVFIYFLTGYLPEKKRVEIQNRITVKLLNQIYGELNRIMSTLTKCAQKSEVNIDNLDEKKFTELCKLCKFTQPSGMKKILRDAPLLLGDTSVKESILNSWSMIQVYLNEIDMASIYIDPAIYDQCMKIRKSSLSITINTLYRQIQNTDFEAWGSQFYVLNQEKIKLEKIIEKLEKR